jgi:hypothetical protein
LSTSAPARGTVELLNGSKINKESDLELFMRPSRILFLFLTITLGALPSFAQSPVEAAPVDLPTSTANADPRPARPPLKPSIPLTPAQEKLLRDLSDILCVSLPDEESATAPPTDLRPSSSALPQPASFRLPPPPAPIKHPNDKPGFNWGPALQQSLLFLSVQHGYAMTQAKTRRALRGPFFKDYFDSVSKLSGWADGGRFFTNYISHPMEGSIAGFIQIQNDPQGRRQRFSRSKSYWVSRLKAMGWNAAYSTQFEIGPISQSAIGNVGLYTSSNGKIRKLSYVDLVVTPTLGTAWLIGEDALDRYVVQRLESKTRSAFMRNSIRLLLNPMRGAANMLRFKTPWYRDRER